MSRNTIEIKIDTVQGSTSGVKKTTADIEREVAASQKRVEANTRRTEATISAAKRQSANAQIRENKRVADEFLRTLKTMESESARSSSRMSGAFKGGFAGGLLGGLSVGVISSVTGAMRTGSSAVFDYSQKLEQANVKFSTLMGGAENARKHIQDLEKLSRSTPLQFDSISKMSSRLQGAGIQAQKIIPLIKDIGNIAAATGELSAERMEGLGTAFSQIASKGRVSAEEMEQLAERGVPAWKILSEAIGKTSAETRKMAEDGKITSVQLFDAFQKFSQLKYGDAMQKQAQTFSGSMGVITNIAKQTASTAFKPIYDEASKFSSRIASSLKEQEANAVNGGASFGFAIGESIGDGVQRGIRAYVVNKNSIWDTLYDSIIKPVDDLGRNIGRGARKGVFGSSTLPPVVAGGNGRFRFTPKLTDPAADAIKALGFGPVSSSSTSSGTSGTKSGGAVAVKKELSPQAKAIIAGADKLGISPVDYATLMLYETAGTLNPWQKGPTTKWGTHRGTIQYGEPQAKAYGAYKGQSFYDQVTGSNVRYLQDRGIRPGASLLDLYKAVNGGNVGASVNASDGYGTIGSHVQKMIRDRRPQAENLFEGGSGIRSDIPGEVDKMLADRSDALTKADQDKLLRQAFVFWTKLGLMPDSDMVKRFQEMLAGDARAAGTLQPSVSDVRNSFLTNSLSRLGPVTDTGSTTVSSSIITRESVESSRTLYDIMTGLTDVQLELNEQTQEEILLRKIQLGQYPELIGGAQELAIAKAKETDILIKGKKDAEEAKEAAKEYQEQQRQVFRETEDFFANKIESFIGGGFKGLWQSILDDMRQNFVKQFSGLLAQAFTPNFSGVSQGGQQGQGGIGGIFQSLFGGGQGQGPGGTPMFNGNNFAGSGGGLGSLGQYDFLKTGGLPGAPGSPSTQGGGLGGLLGGFGLKSNIFTGKAMTGNMSAVSGIGSIAAMAGGMLGGRVGNLMSMTGTGMSIGAMFGPWGAGIGAAIGAGAGLISMLFGRDNATKKLKEAALAQYSITVKDKSVLESLKKVGEQYFGKGKAGENATQVVGLDESKNILRNYAAMTGQSASKVDILSHGDSEWSGNNFRNSRFGGYRAKGGNVYPGLSYVVGERQAEMFTPNVPGYISPSVSSTQGVSNVQMQVILGQLVETIEGWKEQMRSIPKGHMLEMAAAENPRAISRAYESELQSSGKTTEQMFRLTGQMR